MPAAAAAKADKPADKHSNLPPTEEISCRFEMKKRKQHCENLEKGTRKDRGPDEEKEKRRDFGPGGKVRETE